MSEECKCRDPGNAHVSTCSAASCMQCGHVGKHSLSDCAARQKELALAAGCVDCGASFQPEMSNACDACGKAWEAEIRRDTIEECIRAADSGMQECVTGCHARLRALLDK